MVIHSPQPIADRVDKLRKDAGISKPKLSAATGIARTTLNAKLLNGDELTIRQLRLVSNALGVSMASWFAA